MKKYILLSLSVALLMMSCGEYQRLLKSSDPDEKFEAGKNYYQQREYMKSATLFEELIPYYRGTPKAEELLFLLAQSYMGQKDYSSASEYYRTYVRNYPRGNYVRDARYLIGYCYYLQSPDARLEQSATIMALNSLIEYVELYPNSDNTAQAYRYIIELRDKLAYKGYLNAKLYYNLGTYMGNNYQSAVLESENTLKDFPETNYRDDLVFLILQSISKEASLSVAERKKERYSEVIDEYYRYAN